MDYRFCKCGRGPIHKKHKLEYCKKCHDEWKLGDDQLCNSDDDVFSPRSERHDDLSRNFEYLSQMDNLDSRLLELEVKKGEEKEKEENFREIIKQQVLNANAKFDLIMQICGEKLEEFSAKDPTAENKAAQLKIQEITQAIAAEGTADGALGSIMSQKLQNLPNGNTGERTRAIAKITLPTKEEIKAEEKRLKELDVQAAATRLSTRTTAASRSRVNATVKSGKK